MGRPDVSSAHCRFSHPLRFTLNMNARIQQSVVANLFRGPCSPRRGLSWSGSILRRPVHTSTTRLRCPAPPSRPPPDRHNARVDWFCGLPLEAHIAATGAPFAIDGPPGPGTPRGTPADLTGETRTRQPSINERALPRTTGGKTCLRRMNADPPTTARHRGPARTQRRSDLARGRTAPSRPRRRTGHKHQQRHRVGAPSRPGLDAVPSGTPSTAT